MLWERASWPSGELLCGLPPMIVIANSRVKPSRLVACML
jgi:hypothetical protein